MKDYQCFGNCKNRNNERVLYKASLQKQRSAFFFLTSKEGIKEFKPAISSWATRGTIKSLYFFSFETLFVLSM